jgi:ABC-2 type transport system permease protein
MYKRIYFLVIKELLAVWQDKKSRLVLIMPPLLQLFVFAFAATLDVTNISLAVLNKDYGKPSYELIERFKGSSYFKEIKFLRSEQEMVSVMDNQKAIVAVHINEDFSKKLLENKPASIQVILDGRKSNTAQIVQGYIASIVEQYNYELATHYGYVTSRSELINRSWFNPNLIYMWYTVPSLVAILTMVTCLLVTSLSIARERELGTFDQLLVSPLTSMEILIGKAIPGIIIGMIEGIAITLVGIFIFRIPFTGSMLYLIFAMFFFVISMTGVGLFLSSLCKTQQQALLAAFFFISNAVILSGFGSPIENMPIWLQKVTVINPLRYFLVIVRGIFLKEFPFIDVIKNLIPIVVVSGINLSVAGWFFGKRLE